MANKIVQLTQGNDNIFPIAGGMAADSITTAMLQDGSVTSDKVDFTTITIAPAGGTTIVSNNSFRVGPYCFINVIFSGVSFAEGTLGIIDVNLAPVNKAAAMVSAGTGRYGSAFVGTGGGLYMTISGTTGGEVRFTSTYIAATS